MFAARTDLLDEWPRKAFTKWTEDFRLIFSICATRGSTNYYVAILDTYGDDVAFPEPGVGSRDSEAARRVDRWRDAVPSTTHTVASPVATLPEKMYIVLRGPRADSCGVAEVAESGGVPAVDVVFDSLKAANDAARAHLREEIGLERVDGAVEDTGGGDVGLSIHALHVLGREGVRYNEENVGSCTALYTGEAAYRREKQGLLRVWVHEMRTSFGDRTANLKTLAEANLSAGHAQD